MGKREKYTFVSTYLNEYKEIEIEEYLVFFVYMAVDISHFSINTWKWAIYITISLHKDIRIFINAYEKRTYESLYSLG